MSTTPLARYRQVSAPSEPNCESTGKSMRGPGINLAQFSTDAFPFNNLCDIATWAAGLGYQGLQIPTWDRHTLRSQSLAFAATGLSRIHRPLP
jgi:hypothetical protein